MHLLLIVSALVSLALEPVLALHVIFGLAFVLLVVAHLVQRRRTSANLVRHLVTLKGLRHRRGRLAFADAALFVLTVAMLTSGIWDLALGHPTRVRWHAITGVLLVLFLLAHTLRRRRRLRRSLVR